MDVVLVHLFRHSEHVLRVADWIYNEFWRDRPGFNVDTFVGLLPLAVDPGHIPHTRLGGILHDQVTDTFCFMRFGWVPEQVPRSQPTRLPETFHV